MVLVCLRDESNTPSGFTLKLGKHIQTRRLEDVRQIGYDRVEIEVNQIGQKDFLIKVIHTQKRDGFLRLMKSVHSLGLQVIDANVTTCKGRVLNIFKIEATQKDFEPQKLKDLVLTSWTM